MATSVTRFEATITAGTPLDAPLTVQLPLGTNTVNAIRWRVPPGPRGNMGWALTMGGVQVVPDDAGEYIIADNEWDEWEIEGLPDSGAWEVTGYNTGSYDHTVYLDFYTTPVQSTGPVLTDVSVGFPQSEADIPTMWLT